MAGKILRTVIREICRCVKRLWRNLLRRNDMIICLSDACLVLRLEFIGFPGVRTRLMILLLNCMAHDDPRTAESAELAFR